MLTPRENLLKSLRHEMPEWVPIITLCDNYNRPVHLPQRFYQEWMERSNWQALSRHFDVEIMERVGAYTEVYHNVQHTISREGDISIQRWETPYGVITARHKEVRFNCGSAGEPDLVTSFPIEYPVKSVEDYRAFAYILEDCEYALDPEVVTRKVAEVGDRGIVTLSAPSSPLGMCVRAYTGVEHLAYAYHEHHSELCGLLEAIAESYYRCYRGLAELPGDATINYDDTTTLAISPRMFRELEVPFLHHTAEIVHAGGKACIHHACGHIHDLLADLGETGIDGVDGPSLPPVGNTTVAEARAGLGPEVLIIPFTEEHAIRSGDPEVIRGSIRAMFEQASTPRNLIIDIVSPPAIPVENLWLAVDEAKRLAHDFPRAY